MASYEATLDYTLTDVNGDTAQMKVRVYSADTNTLAALQTLASTVGGLINPVTNAKVTRVGVSVLFLNAQISAATAPPPANATYPSVTDGCALSFSNSLGATRRVVIPAPLLTDFITGTNTANDAQADMAALIAEMESLADISGATNLYQGGVKVAHHSRRRAARKHL